MVSIITNIAALAAQSNLRQASETSGSSIARLSSGNAIYKSSDDVSGLAVGTVLQTNVDGLKAALKNTGQASSLLNIADGALDNIQKMLSRQNEIANQATSGALDKTSRGFLDLEFQALSAQIDLTSKNTNFNGIKLIDGSLYNKVGAESDIRYTTDEASMSLTALDLTNNKTITINGVQYTAKTSPAAGANEFQAAASTSTANNITALGKLVEVLNKSTNTNLKGVTFTADTVTPTLTIKSDTAGIAAQMFSVGASSDTALFGNWYNTGVAGYTGSIKTLTKPGMQANGLTGHNLEIKGNTTDNLLKSVTGTKATGSIDLAGLTTATVTNARTVLAANFKTGAGAAGAGLNYSTVTMSDHGLKNGDQIKIPNGGTNLVVDGLTYTYTDSFTVTVVDQNHFRVTASSGTTTTGNVAAGAGVAISSDQQVNINGSTIIFSASPAGPNQVKFGATDAESTANLLTYLNNSTDANIGCADYSLDASGTKINITYKTVGTIGNNYYISSPSTTFTLAASHLANGASGGVDTSYIVNNEEFIGTVSGFEGNYAGTQNKVNLTIKVGDYTYSASDVTTNPTSDTKIIFLSDSTENNFNGGSFTIELAANKGMNVENSADAERFADRIDAAFKGLTFNQKRIISSFSAAGDILTNNAVTGRLDGTSFRMNSKDFNNVEIESFEVTAPLDSNSNASVAMIINGETYSNRAVAGGLITKGSVLTLTSEVNPFNQVFFYNTTDINQDFSSGDKAFNFATSMQEALGLNQGKTTLNFQIGNTTEEVISLGVRGTRITDLFKDENGHTVNLDIATQETAIESVGIIKRASDKITAIRADIGALQSRMDKASSSIQTSIRNQDAARGVFLDTDMASESSKFATAQVKIHASISMLSQANQLPQSLLKLLD